MNKYILMTLGIISLFLVACNTSNTDTEPSGTQETTTIEIETTTEEITTEETFTFEEQTTEEPFVTPEISIIPGEINFSIQVNIGTNCVTIFAKDEQGNFTVPYKAMACSSGLATKEYPQPTPLGTFNLKTGYDWCRMVDWTYSQYAYFIVSDTMFHSTPCAFEWNITEGLFPSPVAKVKNKVKVEEFNKLGQDASLGCIRLTVEDSKWIYDNCPTGTVTTIIDSDESSDPIKKPEVIKINIDAIPKDCGEFVTARFPDSADPYSGKFTTKDLWIAWDPTDPDPRNPWNNYHPEITIPADGIIRVPGGCTPYDFYEYCEVSAIDTCRNDITDTIEVSDISIFKKRGTYENITLSVTDLLGRTESVTVTFEIY